MAKMAREIIEGMTAEPEVGKVYTGVVKGIKEFGAFVEIMPGREGLLHISEIEHRRINRVEDVLKMGDEVTVKLIELGEQGKLKLSRKALLPKDDSPKKM
jgi:polyribonucleotide nucleotidyltransferase